MKSLAPGVFGLVFAGYVYTQAFNVSIDMLKHMQALMDNAAAQLVTVDTGPNSLKI